MKPVLFEIFGTSFYSYYIFITLGIFVGLYFFYKYSKKQDIALPYFLDLSIISIISGYVGGRIFHVLLSMPSYYLEHPKEVFYFWQGGYAIYGATITPILFIYLYSKYKKIAFLKITDALAPSLSIGTAIGRVGCLLQGCCFGKPTTMLWGMDVNGTYVHPTQIYLSLHGLLMFFILAKLFKSKRYDGQLTYWYFLLYSVGRFIIESFRADNIAKVHSLSSFQILSLILFVWSLYEIVKRRKLA